jgi:hypothetical protein
MTRRLWTTVLCAATVAGITVAAASTSDPLQLLFATGVFDARDRSRVESGGAAVTVLPATGRDLAVFGVTRTRASGDRLAARTRAVQDLYRGRYIPAIGRFSEHPQLADVVGLVLDDEDLSDLRKCRPGDCGVKLSAQEMHDVRAAASAAGAAWKAALQVAFRKIVVARARAYLARGLAAAPPYADRKAPVSAAREFDEIAERIGFQLLYGGRVLDYLRSYPDVEGNSADSFLYWSKETLGAGKPIVSITHVAIFRNPPPDPASAVVAARQVYASHYLTGSLSLTVTTNGADGTPAYLAYLRRSRADAFDGLFGGFVRHIVEGRIRADAPALLDVLRGKLEADDVSPVAVSGEESSP